MGRRASDPGRSKSLQLGNANRDLASHLWKFRDASRESIWILLSSVRCYTLIPIPPWRGLPGNRCRRLVRIIMGAMGSFPLLVANGYQDSI